MSDQHRIPLARADTPAAHGLRWPAEWEPHESTWLTWPHNDETWPGIFHQIPTAYSQLVQAIAEFEPVNVIVPPRLHEQVQNQVDQLQLSHPITLWAIESNDAWTRDHGGQFLVSPRDSELAVVDWIYNAWGGKYPPFDADNAIPQQLAQLRGTKLFAPTFVLEPGSIDGNGNGVLLTTESCLLANNRNTNCTIQEAEQFLRDFACAEDVIWLPGNAIPGDDTDGHIDQMARFVSKDKIVFAQPPAGVEFEALRSNRKRLDEQCLGRFEVADLPLPEPKYHQQQRLPASYCNFYFVNNGVLVPTFDDPNDEQALAIISDMFPTRKIVPIDCTSLVVGLGSVHCLTNQEPKAALNA